MAPGSEAHRDPGNTSNNEGSDAQSTEDDSDISNEGPSILAFYPATDRRVFLGRWRHISVSRIARPV